ncbi:MAG: gliding motility-associated C-terminal domain-containing protein [Bacteroidota bacterium]
MFCCRKYFFLIIISLFVLKSQSQNVVPNPSFENFTSCPTGGQFYKLTPWCGLAGGEDAFNTCFNTVVGPGPGGFGIPYTFFGFQYPRTGNGITYIMIIRIGSGTQDNREYIHVPLIKPLKAGKTYCGTMYLNLYNQSKYTTDKIGMYFSSAPYICNQAFPTPQVIAPLNVVPQIDNPGGNFITDTLNWMEVSGSFTATGNEQYLTIGNFYNDAATNTVVVNPSSGYSVTFFFIDDVSLEEIIPAKTINDTSICVNDSIALAQPSPTEFAEYSWQPATGLSCSTCASPKAAPQSSTSYTLTKKQCHAITTDVVTITVKPDCDLKTQLNIPNVFTPNEDGMNDTFMIQLPAGSVLKEFTVHNRWGNLIKTDDLKTQSVILWDGRTTAGEPCTAGVYYYTLQYTDAKGATQKLKGFISLFR